MRVSRKKVLYWFLQVTGWGAYAVLYIVLATIGGVEEDQLVYFYLLQASFFLASTHMFRNLIVDWGWIKQSIAGIIYRVIISVSILTVLNYLFQLLVLYRFDLINPDSDFELINIFTNLFLVFIFYFLWSSIYFLYNYMESYNLNLKQEAAINEIRLNSLKSQLNPHFIFNALNSVRALVDENPARAKLAITQMSNILRNSLVMDKKKVIPFKDEIQTVQDYLNLEHIRFEERLKVSFDFDPDSWQFEVPPLMIQTLVENGIKHGISNLVEGGILSITTRVQDHSLIIRITNSGQFEPGQESKSDLNTGYGLANTKQRLELIYGKAAEFSIRNLDASHVLTEIKIPQRI